MQTSKTYDDNMLENYVPIYVMLPVSYTYISFIFFFFFSYAYAKMVITKLLNVIRYY